MRPAPNQFRIYWDNNSKKYEPDFIVETQDGIYIVETKAESNLQDDDVLQKMTAAKKYCQYASEFTSANSGKKWMYLLVPHSVVNRTISFKFLIAQYTS